MSKATITPPLFLTVVAIASHPLPVFFSAEERPDYVPATVFAIFPAHISDEEFGRYHHHCLVSFGENMGEMFGEISGQFKAHRK